MKLSYTKLRKDVKSPERANPSDAGLDVFYCPDLEGDEHDQESGLEPGTVIINPGRNEPLKTGLAFEIPHGYMLEVKNRSSMSKNKNTAVGGGVLDPGYSGEVAVIMHNLSNGPLMISPGDKIAQLVLIPVVHFQPHLVAKKDLYADEVAMSNREDGGFGSTGE